MKCPQCATCFGAFAVLLPLDFKFMSVDQPRLGLFDLQYLSVSTCTLQKSQSFSFFPPMAQQPLVGQGLLIFVATRSHTDAPPQSVGLLWTSDQPDAKTWPHITFTGDRHACPPRRDSNSHQRLRPRGHQDRLILSQSRRLITRDNIVFSVCYFILS
jgi:hypothetical protein